MNLSVMFEFCLILVHGVALMVFKGGVLGTYISQGFLEKQNQWNGQVFVCVYVCGYMYIYEWMESRDLFQGIGSCDLGN